MPRAKKQCGRLDCDTKVPGGTPYCEEHTQSWKGSIDRHNSAEYKRNRLIALDRDNGVCYRCGATGCTMTDHVIPKVLGGSDAVENLGTICEPCHQEKTRQDGRAPFNANRRR